MAGAPRPRRGMCPIRTGNKRIWAPHHELLSAPYNILPPGGALRTQVHHVLDILGSAMSHRANSRCPRHSKLCPCACLIWRIPNGLARFAGPRGSTRPRSAPTGQCNTGVNISVDVLTQVAETPHTAGYARTATGGLWDDQRRCPNKAPLSAKVPLPLGGTKTTHAAAPRAPLHTDTRTSSTSAAWHRSQSDAALGDDCPSPRRPRRRGEPRCGPHTSSRKCKKRG